MGDEVHGHCAELTITAENGSIISPSLIGCSVSDNHYIVGKVLKDLPYKGTILKINNLDIASSLAGG